MSTRACSESGSLDGSAHLGPLRHRGEAGTVGRLPGGEHERQRTATPFAA